MGFEVGWRMEQNSRDVTETYLVGCRLKAVPGQWRKQSQSEHVQEFKYLGVYDGKLKREINPDSGPVGWGAICSTVVQKELDSEV